MAAAAREMAVMAQFALRGSECKLMAFGMPNAPRWANGDHLGPAWAFHSSVCGKLATSSTRDRKYATHVRTLLQITMDDGAAGVAEEIAAFEKQAERPEDVGLSLAEGKTVTAAIQRQLVKLQIASWAERHRCCEACGARRRRKGSSPVVFRTLYGDVPLASPRLHRCPCQDADGPATLLPLRALILGQIAPERLYLEARWSSLVPYAAAAGLLADVLPDGLRKPGQVRARRA